MRNTGGMNAVNPLLADWQGEWHFPPFSAVQPEHFEPAFEIAMREHQDELAAIAINPDPATFDNTLAAYDLAPGKTLDKNAPYISAPEAGQMGNRAFLYGPKQQKWDVSVGKKTMIGERANVEFRAQAINVFNLQNFLLFVPGSGITTRIASMCCRNPK